MKLANVDERAVLFLGDQIAEVATASDGVGVARKPPVFLEPGDTLESWIEGLGGIGNHIVEGP